MPLHISGIAEIYKDNSKTDEEDVEEAELSYTASLENNLACLTQLRTYNPAVPLVSTHLKQKLGSQREPLCILSSPLHPGGLVWPGSWVWREEALPWVRPKHLE
jgi:hypothetical protein